MQRRPSKRQQKALKSPEPTAQPTTQPVEAPQKTDTAGERQNKKLTSHTSSKVFVTLLCILPFLATLGLFARFYYESIHDHVSHLRELLHDGEAGLSSSIKTDYRINENGQLRPEDHVYRDVVTQTLDWSITAGQRRPDGVDKRVYLINDLFPGPLIEARSGDTLQIHVHNHLEDEQLSLHWHGLNMRGANTMDGVIGVTQCGIQPGQSFWYNFTVSESQSGTFWYHAHSTVQRADGLYGSLIVHRPVSDHPVQISPNVRGLLIKHQELKGKDENDDALVPDSIRYSYDKEIVLMIGDWYHRSAKDVASWYLWWGSRGYEPVPDSLLVNGAGRFDCSRAVPARPLDCIGSTDERPPLVLDGHSSYRIRVVNTGSLAGITLGFAPDSSIQVITLDGGSLVEMNAADNSKSSLGILFPGQRVDFVLRPTTDKTSWISVKLDESDFKIGNPALETHQIFPLLQRPHALSSNPPPPSSTTQNESLTNTEADMININNLPSKASLLNQIPTKASQTHMVYAKIEKLSRLKNIPYGFFNRTTWSIQKEPPYPLLGLPRNQWDKNQLTVSTGQEGGWVDLVVNNLDEGAHPFHFHGHSFYVVALYESPAGSSRWGSYNPWAANELEPYDLSKAVLRDTVQIPRRGYAVLRFKADNPGVWLFHCHVMWHLAGGMAMLIDSGSESDAVAHEPWLGTKGLECRV